VTHSESLYFANFHFMMKCGIIWGDNSTNSKSIFALQMKIAS
jgi:hypothetical protein